MYIYQVVLAVAMFVRGPGGDAWGDLLGTCGDGCMDRGRSLLRHGGEDAVDARAVHVDDFEVDVAAVDGVADLGESLELGEDEGGHGVGGGRFGARRMPGGRAFLVRSSEAGRRGASFFRRA